MSDATPTMSPWGIPENDLLRLVVLGKTKGVLSMDEVVHVLRTVELTAEVIEGVRSRLASEGIELDESIPPADVDDAEVLATDLSAAPAPALPEESVEASSEEHTSELQPL